MREKEEVNAGVEQSNPAIASLDANTSSPLAANQVEEDEEASLIIHNDICSPNQGWSHQNRS